MSYPARWRIGLGLAAVFTASPLFAAEGAVSLYAPGFFSTMAGVMPEQGTYGDVQLWVYDGNVEDAFLENQVVFNIDSDMVVPMFSLLHVTDLTIFGGQYGFSVMGSYPFVDVAASLNINNDLYREKQSNSGPGDLTLTPVMLGWHGERWQQILMVNVYTPTGDWDIDDLATTGLNRWAVEPMYNATWFDEETGREFSLAAGYTINFKNNDTGYESGDELHLDYTLAQWFPSGWMAGLAGYWLQQVTADNGAPEILGSNKGKVFGAGPIISYLKSFSDEGELIFSARFYREFGAANRPEGNSLWLRASFQF